MKFNPLGDKLLVRRGDEEETSAGGIVLPGSAAEKPSQGEVLAVGPGKTLDNGEKVEVSVKVGDVVVFEQYAGNNTIKIDGEELLIYELADLSICVYPANPEPNKIKSLVKFFLYLIPVKKYEKLY